MIAGVGFLFTSANTTKHKRIRSTSYCPVYDPYNAAAEHSHSSDAPTQCYVIPFICHIYLTTVKKPTKLGEKKHSSYRKASLVSTFLYKEHPSVQHSTKEAVK